MIPEKDQVALLIIGDEILSGRTVDKNLGALALWCGEQGLGLHEVRVVKDIEADIIGALNALRARYAHVFTTGGIGPTHDDITAASVAVAFGVSLVTHPEARNQMLRHYDGDEAKLTPARLKMAMVPEGAELIPNRVSGAPGFTLENVYVLAGIPVVMQAMLEGLRDTVRGDSPVLVAALTAYGAESDMADMLATVEKKHDGLTIGSYPFYRRGVGGACLVVRGLNADAVSTAMEAIRGGLSALGIQHQDGEPDLS